MTPDNSQFEFSLPESLGELASGAPAGPDAARVLGALSRRRMIRGVAGSAAACVLLMVGALTWYLLPGQEQYAAAPAIATPALPIIAPDASGCSPPLSFTLPVPVSAFKAPAIASPLPAVRMEAPSLSTFGTLRGPGQSCAMTSYMPSLAFSNGAGETTQTPSERKLQ